MHLKEEVEGMKKKGGGGRYSFLKGSHEKLEV